jgi:hypothetical protein
MRPTERWIRRSQIRLGPDAGLEQARTRFHQRLCDERAQLAVLIAELQSAGLSVTACYSQLQLLGHRLCDAAGDYGATPIVEAAAALEEAAIDACEKYCNNPSTPVWQAIEALLKVLPAEARRAGK